MCPKVHFLPPLRWLCRKFTAHTTNFILQCLLSPVCTVFLPVAYDICFILLTVCNASVRSLGVIAKSSLWVDWQKCVFICFEFASVHYCAGLLFVRRRQVLSQPESRTICFPTAGNSLVIHAVTLLSGASLYPTAEALSCHSFYRGEPLCLPRPIGKITQAFQRVGAQMAIGYSLGAGPVKKVHLVINDLYYEHFFYVRQHCNKLFKRSVKFLH